LSDPKSKLPYENQSMPVVEKGSKRLRGYLTEGRYLVFRAGRHSLQSIGRKLVVGKSTLKAPAEVFIVHQVNGSFHVVNNKTKNCINTKGHAINLGSCGTTAWNVTYNPNGATYTLHESKTATSFQVYSVRI
jgi:phospholipase C